MAVTGTTVGRSASPIPPPRPSGSSRSRRSSAGVSDARRQPWASSRFWLLEFVVLAVALVRLAVIVHFGLSLTAPAVESSTLLLYLPLVTIAALAFGLPGATGACGCIALLSVPLLLGTGRHEGGATLLQLLQLLVLCAVGLASGWVVSHERRDAREARRALRTSAHANAVYRQLFDSNASPILVVDGSGTVVDANASASRVFPRVATALLRPSPDGPDGTGTRLIDAVGAEAAGLILGNLMRAPGQAPPGAERPNDDEVAAADSDSTVEILVDGDAVVFRPSSTFFFDDHDRRQIQVVFQDVTEDRRRRELVTAFAEHVVLGQEEERRRISQELHDGPLQGLMQLLRDVDALETDASRERRRRMRTYVEDLVAELRAISRGLRPSTLDDLGLVASIEGLLGELERRLGVSTSVGVSGHERRLPSDVELALFRIAQEALSNAERHARAHTVAVGLDYEGAGVRLLVKDDGVGFRPAGTRRAGRGRSLGLSGMAERAGLIGATLDVRTAPGAGTSIDVRVPAAILEEHTRS